MEYMSRGSKILLVDTYISLFITYSYAKVAAVLCKFGPLKYALKVVSILSDDWLLENRVPNIVKVFGK